MDTIPYLLAKDNLNERILKKFNALKRQEEPQFVPIKYAWELNSRPELRADTLWSQLVPKADKTMSLFTTRYVLIPIEMVPFVTIDEYDGGETHHIDYNKYGIKKIQTILSNTHDANTLPAIQAVIDTVLRECDTSNK